MVQRWRSKTLARAKVKDYGEWESPITASTSALSALASLLGPKLAVKSRLEAVFWCSSEVLSLPGLLAWRR